MRLIGISAVLAITSNGEAMRASWLPSAGTKPAPPRSGHTCTSGPDGSCLLFGGYAEFEGDSPRDVVNDLWRYSDGQWECLQPATARQPSSTDQPGGRLCSASAVIGDELFIFGGWDPETAGTGGSILDDMWCLNLGSLQWERLPNNMPQGPTSRHVACAVQTPDGPRILIHTFRCSTSVIVFDAASRTTTQVDTTGPAPSSRGLHAAAAAGSRVMIFGGAAKDGQVCQHHSVLVRAGAVIGHHNSTLARPAFDCTDAVSAG
jgi:hypothetical protein